MNNEVLHFSPVFPAPTAVVIAILLFAFLTYSEFKRRQKFLFARIVASGLVVVSLLALVLHPGYREEKKTDSILLLTRGYRPDKVDSVIQKHPELDLVRAQDAAPYPNSQVLKSWYALADRGIFGVVGEGMPSYVLDMLPDRTFQFIPSALPPGINRLNIPNLVHANSKASLQGVYRASEKTKLKLAGPGGVEDSVSLGKGDTSFSLSFTPKQSGNFIYTLVAEDSRGSTPLGRVPLNIAPERLLKILFIQKFPTGEVRFLKNFLSEKKHRLGLRYQVSKSSFRYEYANMPSFRMDQLGEGILNSFDLLFIDQKSYDDLNASEKNALKESIDQGLGVIFLPHDTGDKALTDFLLLKSTKTAADTVHLRLPSHPYVLPVLPIEFNAEPSLLSVTRNKNRVLSGYRFHGQGKVGFQLIQETYPMLTGGNASDYAALWAALVEMTARTAASDFKLKIITPFPYYTNEPMEVVVMSSGIEPSVYADSVRIAMKESPIIDDYWTGTNWTANVGWHQLNIAQDSSHLHYFVSDTSEWRSLKISNQIAGNRIFAGASTAGPQGAGQQVPVAAVWFYLLFLIGSAFLWLAPKI